MAVPVHLHLRDLRRRLGSLTPKPGVNPFLAGLAGRCPNCGEGPLFEGFLRVSATCSACGFDLAKADSGDGPAVFVIIIAGFLAVFGALFTEVAARPPIWLNLSIWMLVALGLCLALLRPTKGLMLAAQFANRASEAGRDDI
ncbi:DUF983 domain-containing protein [Caulobacter sp. KR2-114]|uniref:DUF983 domain-containing protein n=1 Tax=Caulobacter sp. KR2-114 TaxID=3400912 RepID=UPI003C2E1D97